MADTGKMDRNLALEAVRVTEAAALAASKLMGRGDEKAADQAAVDAMRTALNALAIDGTVVIGEGERDEAPMLYIGEKVGAGGPKIDIALDPLEGTTITAKGLPNALAVIAMAEHGGFLNAPDVYMDKIAVGGGLPDGIVDLDKTPQAEPRRPRQGQEGRGRRSRGLHPRPAAPCRADRQGARGGRAHHADRRRRRVGRDRHLDRRYRHRHLYGLGRRAGRRAGGGGAALHRRPDAGPAAVPQRRREGRARSKWGITDLNRKYSMLDLAKGDVMFAATGVTTGSMLKGVRRFPNGAETHSIVMRSKTGTVRWISAHHNFSIKTGLPSWA